MFQTDVLEKVETHILRSTNFIIRKLCRLSDNVEKFVQPDRSHDNVAPAHYMLGPYGYKHILRICNNYCFSTITTVVRKGLIVMSHVNFLVY